MSDMRTSPSSSGLAVVDLALLLLARQVRSVDGEKVADAVSTTLLVRRQQESASSEDFCRDTGPKLTYVRDCLTGIQPVD